MESAEAVVASALAALAEHRPSPALAAVAGSTTPGISLGRLTMPLPLLQSPLFEWIKISQREDAGPGETGGLSRGTEAAGAGESGAAAAAGRSQPGSLIDRATLWDILLALPVSGAGHSGGASAAWTSLAPTNRPSALCLYVLREAYNGAATAMRAASDTTKTSGSPANSSGGMTSASSTAAADAAHMASLIPEEQPLAACLSLGSQSVQPSESAEVSAETPSNALPVILGRYLVRIASLTQSGMPQRTSGIGAYYPGSPLGSASAPLAASVPLPISDADIPAVLSDCILPALRMLFGNDASEAALHGQSFRGSDRIGLGSLAPLSPLRPDSVSALSSPRDSMYASLPFPATAVSISPYPQTGRRSHTRRGSIKVDFLSSAKRLAWVHSLLLADARVLVSAALAVQSGQHVSSFRRIGTDVIALDVDRCRFPIFRTGEGRRRMLALLRGWLALNPECEYRQYMSVIASMVASVYLSPELTKSSDLLAQLCRAFLCFDRVVVGFLGTLLHPETTTPLSRVTQSLPLLSAATFGNDSVCSSIVGNRVANHPLAAESASHCIPISLFCESPSSIISQDLFRASAAASLLRAAPLYAASESARLSQLSQVLRWVDPLLGCFLQDIQLEPELYAIPFVTTLFADGLTTSDALAIWDIIFCTDERFPLFLAVAVLLQVRHLLLGSAARDPYGHWPVLRLAAGLAYGTRKSDVSDSSESESDTKKRQSKRRESTSTFVSAVGSVLGGNAWRVRRPSTGSTKTNVHHSARSQEPDDLYEIDGADPLLNSVRTLMIPVGNGPVDFATGLVILSKLRDGGLAINWWRAANDAIRLWSLAPQSIGAAHSWPEIPCRVVGFNRCSLRVALLEPRLSIGEGATESMLQIPPAIPESILFPTASAVISGSNRTSAYGNKSALQSPLLHESSSRLSIASSFSGMIQGNGVENEKIEQMMASAVDSSAVSVTSLVLRGGSHHKSGGRKDGSVGTGTPSRRSVRSGLHTTAKAQSEKQSNRSGGYEISGPSQNTGLMIPFVVSSFSAKQHDDTDSDDTESIGKWRGKKSDGHGGRALVRIAHWIEFSPGNCNLLAEEAAWHRGTQGFSFPMTMRTLIRRYGLLHRLAVPAPARSPSGEPATVGRPQTLSTGLSAPLLDNDMTSLPISPSIPSAIASVIAQHDTYISGSELFPTMDSRTITRQMLVPSQCLVARLAHIMHSRLGYGPSIVSLDNSLLGSGTSGAQFRLQTAIDLAMALVSADDISRGESVAVLYIANSGSDAVFQRWAQDFVEDILDHIQISVVKVAYAAAHALVLGDSRKSTSFPCPRLGQLSSRARLSLGRAARQLLSDSLMILPISLDAFEKLPLVFSSSQSSIPTDGDILTRPIGICATLSSIANATPNHPASAPGSNSGMDGGPDTSLKAMADVFKDVPWADISGQCSEDAFLAREISNFPPTAQERPSSRWRSRDKPLYPTLTRNKLHVVGFANRVYSEVGERLSSVLGNNVVLHFDGCREQDMRGARDAILRLGVPFVSALHWPATSSA
jgi:hypothetical protein